MSELNFSGNCLRGSRPILSFDAAFDDDDGRRPHLRLVRELLLHVFGVPQGARRSKPFVDRVMGFSVADGRIWVRNYQINESETATATATDRSKDGDEAAPGGNNGGGLDNKGRAGGGKELDIGLVEIGPRFVLTPSTCGLLPPPFSSSLLLPTPISRRTSFANPDGLPSQSSS